MSSARAEPVFELFVRGDRTLIARTGIEPAFLALWVLAYVIVAWAES